MALTTCPDCGKQVSDKAPTCPNCGCPIAKPKQNKTVRIALPNTDALSGGGIAGLLIAKNATVFAGLDLLWSANMGKLQSLILIRQPRSPLIWGNGQTMSLER